MKKEEEVYKTSIVITEINLWLQYTSQEEILARLKYSLVKIAKFIATTTTNKPELERLLQSQEQIVQHSLGILAVVSNYKDILK